MPAKDTAAIRRDYIAKSAAYYDTWDAVIMAWLLCGYYGRFLMLTKRQVHDALAADIVWC